VIPKGYESAAPDTVPSAEAVAKMMEYNKAVSCMLLLGSSIFFIGRVPLISFSSCGR
jgi:hypothetical protein